MLDGRSRVAEVASERLQAVVRLALGEPGATLGAWGAEPLMGGAGAFNPRRSLYSLQGAARVGPAQRSWSVILKGFAPVAARDDSVQGDEWKREWLVYDSGILDALSAGPQAPRCYASDERADGSVWLWLEHIREDGERSWSLARWALAARHLGQFNGASLAGRSRPWPPWLGGRRLRAWVERHRPLVAQIAAAPDNPDVRRWWPRPVADAILRLWEERDTFCAALGEEVGQTLSVAGAFFDVAPADLPALDEALFASYLAGLRDAGWRGDPVPVRFAYAAHAPLRNAFNAVGASVPDAARRAAAQQNYGHPWEDLAGRSAALRPFLLDRADEARRLMGGF